MRKAIKIAGASATFFLFCPFDKAISDAPPRYIALMQNAFITIVNPKDKVRAVTNFKSPPPTGNSLLFGKNKKKNRHSVISA